MLAKPDWLKVNLLPSSQHFKNIKKELSTRSLATVCEEAKCPNIAECWENKTATIMILGDTCTRGCRFCNVKTGNPKGFIDPNEIDHACQVVRQMNLRYLVITSVDRDDLPDGGAGHFARLVTTLKSEFKGTKFEVLIPDFRGKESSMHTLASSDPFVIAQNQETVKRLSPIVRDPKSSYECTLSVLQFYKKNYPHIPLKSSLMVGLGETMEELRVAISDLIDVGVEILTFGQYLRPTMRHLPVAKYYHPDEFKQIEALAYELGAQFVAAGPLVRSSYKAAQYLDFLDHTYGNERLHSY